MTLRGRALLADDDPDMRRALSRVLRGMGLDVVEAADGGRLLVAISSQYRETFSPDDVVLIVTDVQMPVASGLEILEALRTASWHQPAIVISAHVDDGVREAAKRLGAVLVPKPIDLEVLERTVQDLLATRK
jgi:CheY-like chemotaxis protein